MNIENATIHSSNVVKKRSAAIRVLQRFFVPSFVVTLYYLIKFGAKVSPRAEVELTPNISFGKGCVVSSFTKMKATDGPLVMGDGGGFATNCFIDASSGGVYIGNNFICGPGVSIVGSNFVYNRLSERVHSSRGIKIGNNVWVGSNSTILDGAELSDNTVVYANSVVNRKFPPNVVLQGCPAKVVFEMKPRSTPSTRKPETEN